MSVLCNQLKDMVDGYFGSYPNVSINGLAKKSGVGATTIRRIINGSLKGDPAPHTVLNLVSSIKKETNLANIILRTNGAIRILLEDSFGSFVAELESYKYDPNLNQELTDPIKYIIYKLSSNRIGTSKTTILNMFGFLGEEHLNELIKKGLLFTEDGRIHAKEKNFSIDINLAVKHTPFLLNFYKPEEIKEGHNLFYSLSESLSIEGIKKIKEIQKAAIKEIHTIMNSPYFEGEIPYFSFFCMDTLNLSNNKGIKNETTKYATVQ